MSSYEYNKRLFKAQWEALSLMDKVFGIAGNAFILGFLVALIGCPLWGVMLAKGYFKTTFVLWADFTVLAGITMPYWFDDGPGISHDSH